VVPFSLGNVHCHLLKRPEHLKLALETEDWPPVSRGRLMVLDKWYGGGLILTEGTEHHRQRDELWKPILADPAAPGIAVARAARRADSWVAGAPVELFSELRSLCWSIDWETLTGEDLDATPELLHAQEAGTAAMQWLLGPFGSARWNWPLPASTRTRAAKERLDGAIDAMIVERRARPRSDLLSQLVARESDDELVRATFKQWLGADQLHALFTWTLHLLAGHPDVEARWHSELDEVLEGGRAATADDVPRLRYTIHVVKEALRLYPPIWGFFRQVTADYALDGVTIPAGHVIAMSQWVTHRDPDLWPDADRFDPDRWGDGAAPPPDVSYFPFSAGPYECHARGLATTEAILVLATLGQRFSFRPVSDRPPRPTATGTIVPKGGMRMTPVAR
jgi:cytochrome P450